jgi:hypothetical protein
MGLLRTLLILVIAYYGFKFLAKFFAPFLVKKMAEKMQQKAKEASNQNQQQQQPEVREGETIIDSAPENKSRTKNSLGDYVDFEEID